MSSDGESFKVRSKYVQEEVRLEGPPFVTITYRPNERMCGGKALVKRYNTVMESNFLLDTPINVISALRWLFHSSVSRELLWLDE